QVKLLDQRDDLIQTGQKAWKAGEQAEAIAALEKVLKIDQDVLGPWQNHTLQAASQLATWHEARGEWARLANCRRLVLDGFLRLHGEGDWRTVNARLGLTEALAQAKRTPAQRQALVRASELSSQAIAHYQRGQPAKGIPLARQVLALRKEAL